MNIEIVHAHEKDDPQRIAKLAQEIWRQHFTSIIGRAQVEYMLEQFQSRAAIAAQIESGWEYYLARNQGEAIGYAGLVPDAGTRKMMLSKLYIRQAERGRGVGRALLAFIENRCRSGEFAPLWLTVNRFNDATVAWYQRHGFTIVDEVKKDIGNGFFMDDYIMEKPMA